ncbi:hypothetical protein B0H34DRAFT_676665 [Crassisporium funariophilum]|nr:hypothetical protein B0H34DRAFT_676665 [Crassisporium funariophilum]
MHLKNLSLGLALLVTSTPQVLALSARSPSALLVPRQAVRAVKIEVISAMTDAPATAMTSPFETFFQTCKTAACICSSAALANLLNCMGCDERDGSTDIALVMRAAAAFQTACARRGINVTLQPDLPNSASSLTDTAPTSFPTSDSQHTMRPSTTVPVDTTYPPGTDGAGLSGGSAGVTGGVPSIVAGQGVATLLGVALGIVAMAV